MNYELHNPHPSDPYLEQRKQLAANDPNQQDERDPERLAEALRTIPRTRHDRHDIDELYSEYGTAFEVYLERIWTPDVGMENLEQDFLNCYFASYEKLEHFLDDQLDAAGLLQPVKQALKGIELADEVLDWMRVGVQASFADEYNYIERDGMIHVFYDDVPAKGDE